MATQHFFRWPEAFARAAPRPLFGFSTGHIRSGVLSNEPPVPGSADARFAQKPLFGIPKDRHGASRAAPRTAHRKPGHWLQKGASGMANNSDGGRSAPRLRPSPTE